MKDDLELKNIISKRKQITGIKKCRELLYEIIANNLRVSNNISIEEELQNSLNNNKIRFTIMEKEYVFDNKISIKLKSEYRGDIVMITFTSSFIQ